MSYCCCCSCYFCCLHSVCVCVCVCVAFCIFWLWGNSATIYANCVPIAEIALSQFQLSHRGVCISHGLSLSFVCALRSLTLSWLKLFIVYFVANEFSYLLPQFDLFSMFSWPPHCARSLSLSLPSAAAIVCCFYLLWKQAQNSLTKIIYYCCCCIFWARSFSLNVKFLLRGCLSPRPIYS